MDARAAGIIAIILGIVLVTWWHSLPRADREKRFLEASQWQKR